MVVVHLPPVAAAVVPVVFVPVGWRPLAVAVVVAMVAPRAVAAVVVAQAQVRRKPVAVVLVPVGWRPRAVAVAFLSPVIFLLCSRPCQTEASGWGRGIFPRKCAGARDLPPSPWRSVSARTEVGREVELPSSDI